MPTKYLTVVTLDVDPELLFELDLEEKKKIYNMHMDERAVRTCIRPIHVLQATSENHPAYHAGKWALIPAEADSSFAIGLPLPH